MALSKKTLKIIFIAAIVIVVVAIILYVFRCEIFSLSSCVEDPNKSNTPLPAGATGTQWAKESFPLNVGMYGSNIKALQSALGITADGKFGQQTQSAILSKGKSVPLSEADYNILLGKPAPSNLVKGAYAKYDNTIIRNKDLTQNRIANKGEWLGSVTDLLGEYYELDSTYLVYKTSVDRVA